MNARVPDAFSVEPLEQHIVRTAITGDLGEDALKAFLDAVRIASDGSTCFVSICDIERLGTVSPEARRYAKTLPQLLPQWRAVILYGGGFAQRMFAKLVLKATNVISPSAIQFDFVADETAAVAEARRVLRDLRRVADDG